MRYLMTYDGKDFDQYKDRFKGFQYKRMDFKDFTLLVLEDGPDLERIVDEIPNTILEKESRYSISP